MCFGFPVVAGFWVCFTIDLLSRLFLPFFQRVLDWCLAPLFLVYFFKAARMARIYNKGTTHWNVVLPAYNLQGGMVFDRRSSSSSSSTSSRHHQDMIDNKKQRLYDHPDFYLEFMRMIHDTTNGFRISTRCWSKRTQCSTTPLETHWAISRDGVPTQPI